MKPLRKLLCGIFAALLVLTAVPRLSAYAANVAGDINSDGICDVQDAVLLRDFLIAKEKTISQAADIDRNRKINATDLTLLKRLISGRETATLMIYLCGADLEGNQYEASNDFIEMQQAAFTDSLNVVIQTGGTLQWHTRGLKNQGNNRILINGDGMQIGTQSEVHYMNDPETLSTFIQDAADAFPADHYGLIFWGHGMGSLYGLCFDQLSRQQLTLPALKQGLEDGGVHFDWIGFDSCLMATAETAFAVRDYADYMIASTESISGYGWDYTGFLSEWAADPGIPTQQLITTIAEDMMTVHTENELPAAISAYDLSCAEELMNAVYVYTGELFSDFQAKGIDPITAARAKMRDYGDEVYDMVDLDSLVRTIDLKHSKNVRDLLQQMVFVNLTYGMEESCGMTLWFFELHPEDAVHLLEDTYTPIGISSSYIKQMKEMALAAYSESQLIPAPA